MRFLNTSMIQAFLPSNLFPPQNPSRHKDLWDSHKDSKKQNFGYPTLMCIHCHYITVITMSPLPASHPDSSRQLPTHWQSSIYLSCSSRLRTDPFFPLLSRGSISLHHKTAACLFLFINISNNKGRTWEKTCNVFWKTSKWTHKHICDIINQTLDSSLETLWSEYMDWYEVAIFLRFISE